jgi:hypothetical protein
MKRVLCDSILGHFDLIWGMYEEAMIDIQDEHWSDGDIEYLIPARQCFHVIETADYYSSDKQDAFPWGHRFGVRARETTRDNYPSQSSILRYHRDVQERITDWIETLGDEGLLRSQDVFRWTGDTVLSRLLYVLSHYRQHFGEINAELRRRGLPRIKWKTVEESDHE